jgi:hypothetical protein
MDSIYEGYLRDFYDGGYWPISGRGRCARFVVDNYGELIQRHREFAIEQP